MVFLHEKSNFDTCFHIYQQNKQIYFLVQLNIISITDISLEQLQNQGNAVNIESILIFLQSSRPKVNYRYPAFCFVKVQDTKGHRCCFSFMILPLFLNKGPYALMPVPSISHLRRPEQQNIHQRFPFHCFHKPWAYSRSAILDFIQEFQRPFICFKLMAHVMF